MAHRHTHGPRYCDPSQTGTGRSSYFTLLSPHGTLRTPQQNSGTLYSKRKYIHNFKEPDHPYTRFFPKLRAFVGNEGEDGDKRGILFCTEDYLALVDWLGRSIRQDKRGAIPTNIAPILQRLGLSADNLIVSLSTSQERGIAHGKRSSLSDVAQFRNQSRLWASRLCIANQLAPP